MLDVAGSVVIVTGGSRGIGRAVALELGRGGADVAVHYREASDRAEEVVGQLRALGVEARTFRADVTDPEALATMVNEAGRWKGRHDGVVTCAGIFRGPSVEEVDTAEWEAVVRTDLGGTFHTVRAALPYLRASERAAVVTFSSVLGAHAAIGGAPYQAAKAGVEQMTRALAFELAPRIRVNGVAPGFIRTDMNRAGHQDPAFHQAIARATPLGRWGESEDVAPVVRYLLSREARWVTGVVIGVDGGITMR